MIKELEKLLSEISKESLSGKPSKKEMKYIMKLKELRENDAELYIRHLYAYHDVINSKLGE